MIEMIKKSVQMECDKTIMTVILMIYVVGWLLRGNKLEVSTQWTVLKCFEYYCQLSRKELILRLLYVTYSFNISSTRFRSNCFMRFEEMPKTHFGRLPLYFLLTLTDSLEPTVYTFQSIQCIQTTNTIITTIPKRIVLTSKV